MPVNLLATPAAELYSVPGVRWGITEAGIRKAGRRDLSVLLLAEGASVGAVFTQNRFCAARDAAEYSSSSLSRSTLPVMSSASPKIVINSPVKYARMRGDAHALMD